VLLCFVVAVASFELGFAKAVLGRFHSYCWLRCPWTPATALHRCTTAPLQGH
jgi:hypothetical protein